MVEPGRMNGLPYYKRYPRDFIEGTVGLPFEVKVTYSFILDLIYMHGGYLPDDPRYISGHLGVSVRKWNSLRQALIDVGKIQVADGCLSNYRAVSVLESLVKLSCKMRENRLGWRKNKDLQEQKIKQSEPDKKERDTKVSPKKVRGTRLSKDWNLPKDWGDWAIREGWSDSVIRTEADKFRDYWISKAGKDATKLDWGATWRNWMRNSKSPKIVNGEIKHGTPSRNEAWVDAFVQGARGSS